MIFILWVDYGLVYVCVSVWILIAESQQLNGRSQHMFKKCLILTHTWTWRELTVTEAIHMVTRIDLNSFFKHFMQWKYVKQKLCEIMTKSQWMHLNYELWMKVYSSADIFRFSLSKKWWIMKRFGSHSIRIWSKISRNWLVLQTEKIITTLTTNNQQHWF